MNPTDNHVDHALISKYIRDYNDPLKQYCEKFASFAAERCRKSLNTAGIPAIVTSRAKSSKKLHPKLRKKAAEGKLERKDRVQDAVKDLSGVRIALFFPSDKDQVAPIIASQFELREGDTRKFVGEDEIGKKDPQTGHIRRMPGYSAEHYIVRITEQDARANGWDVDDRIRIEIQVQSVLQHAWSEVQHDSVYKVIEPTTPEERRILDDLRGVINLGERFLDQLRDSQSLRKLIDEKPFDSIYESGLFVSRSIPEEIKKDHRSLGPIEVLKKVLEVTQMDTPKALAPVIKGLDFGEQTGSNYSKVREQYLPCDLKISIYIADHILQRPGIEEVTKRRWTDAKRQADTDLLKLRVVLRSIVWLDDLFTFADWWSKLRNHTQRLQLRAWLKWLKRAECIAIVSDGKAMTSENRKIVDSLWNYFATHEERVVRLVYGISNLFLSPDEDRELHLLRRALLQISPTD